MHFKCPKCGGWAFGSCGWLPGDIVQCNSWQDGTAGSNEFCCDEPGHLASMKRTRGFKLCRWRGPRQDAFTGDDAWAEETYRKRMELRERLQQEDLKLSGNIT